MPSASTRSSGKALSGVGSSPPGSGTDGNAPAAAPLGFDACPFEGPACMPASLPPGTLPPSGVAPAGDASGALGATQPVSEATNSGHARAADNARRGLRRTMGGALFLANSPSAQGGQPLKWDQCWGGWLCSHAAL